VNVWFTVLLFLGPIFVLMAVLRNSKRVSLLRSETTELCVDEFGVRRILADGREEGVEWGEVTEVEVLTSNSGPHGPSGGVVIVAGDESHGCLVPLDRLQDSGLAEALARLPGFDSRKLLDALVAKPPSRTVCWQRSV